MAQSSNQLRSGALTDRARLKLGLIGDNIAASRAPVLHRLAGAQNGIDVQYDRLVPRTIGTDFSAVFEQCRTDDYRGINVTYPYKETVTRMVTINDPLVRAIGAVNTVIFAPGGPQGHNTDYSGFNAAYRRARGSQAPGAVVMIGAGGVGRAVAFALASLNATALRIVDRDIGKACTLATDLRDAVPEMDVTTWQSAEKAADGVHGLINCTPVGMVGYEGTPLNPGAMSGAQWAFDAVYTPADTQFLQDAKAADLSVILGWELFFYQGVHAWAHFSGTPLDEAALRAALLRSGDTG